MGTDDVQYHFMEGIMSTFLALAAAGYDFTEPKMTDVIQFIFDALQNYEGI